MKKSFYLSGLLVFCFILSSVASRAQAPVITTDPHDTTVCSGTTAQFVTKSTGATDKMWQVWNVVEWDTVHNGGIYSGATSDTLKIAASMAQNGLIYRSIVFNGPDSDTSDAATLTVDTLNVGVISGASSLLCAGSTYTLTNTVPGGTWSTLHPAISTITATGALTGVSFGMDTARYTVTTVACGSGFSSFSYRVDTLMTAAPIVGSTATCVGSTILLTNANVLGSFAWTVSNGNATIGATTGFLTGVTAGLDTVTYTITNGCNTVLSEHVVTIDTPFTPGTISGPSTVCAASSIHLTSSVTGGMWISSSTAVAIVDASGNVTGISQGTAVISYFRSNGCGAVVATHTVTVDVPVGPIMGIDSVGVGATRTLTNATVGGTWSISDTTATISSSGVVTGVHIGAANVTYSVINSCGTSFSTLTIYIGLPPSAGTIFSSTGKDTVCVGGTLLVRDTTAQAPGVWSVSNGKATIDATTGVMTGVNRGRDTVFYTVTNGFGSSVARKVLLVYSAAIDSVKGPLTVAIGGAYTMQGYPSGGRWTSDNDTAAVIINPVTGYFVVTDYGTAVFTYTIHSALCGDSSMTYLFSFRNTAGVAATNNAAGDLKVYPNPANGSFTFSLASDITAPVSVVITNVVGAKVKAFTTTTNRATSVELDQPAGMYIITASSDAGTYTTKVMIAK